MTIIRSSTGALMVLAILCSFGITSALASAQSTKLIIASSQFKAPLPSKKPIKLSAKSVPAAAILQPKAASNDSILASGDPLKLALDDLYNGDVQQVLRRRQELLARKLDWDLLTWAIATSAIKGVPSDVIANAMLVLKGWPGITIMHKNWERALVDEDKSPATLIKAFAANKPVTAQGMAALGGALIQVGDVKAARQLVAPWWISAKLTANEETLLLAKVGPALTPSDHFKRMRIMLFASRLTSAERAARLAGAVSLYEAFAAVVRNDPQAAKKLNAVDKKWRNDPTLLYSQIQYLRRNGAYDRATGLMLRAPTHPDLVIDPDAWWKERRVLSREMLDLNKPQLAYKIVANRASASPTSNAEAEFHAGWYALRFIHNSELAERHFAKISQLSSRPISQARAYYWLGRSAEVRRDLKQAQHYFIKAAHFGTTYYGQLAAARLGRTTLDIPYPKPTTAERQKFAARETVQAIKMLEQLGFSERSRALFLELSETLKNPGELALLAAMAERQGDHYTSLKIGKSSVLRGLDVGSLSHPLGAIPNSANISASGKALAYAIARQESEFNSQAVSSAGARGILQLMPATAKSIALRNGLPFSLEKLTDPGYNATLGAYFLREQLERFNGSYLLTLIGYNAGPRRAEQWIAQYGDPRGRPIDSVVDWVERIPYGETRNYVMRVMENYEVYRARLTGTADISDDIIAGRRQ